MMLGPSPPIDGYNPDGETIQNGVPQSGVLNDISGLIQSGAQAFTNAYRTVTQAQTPPGTLVTSSGNLNLGDIVIPALLILAVVLGIKGLS